MDIILLVLVSIFIVVIGLCSFGFLLCFGTRHTCRGLVSIITACLAVTGIYASERISHSCNSSALSLDFVRV
jgi:hypothetical protein